MKTMLKEDAGLPRRLLYTLAVISGVSVANLYYNQPLLDMIRQDLGISTLAANHIALYSQAGYALGLLFLIPLADLVSRRRILLGGLRPANPVAGGDRRGLGHPGDPRFLGSSSASARVVPQFFIPLAAQYSRPEEKTATWHRPLGTSHGDPRLARGERRRGRMARMA